MTDLANCPFCGDVPVIRRTKQDYPADDVHPAGQYEAAVHVCCVTCGFELVEEYQSEVIAAWNRRATARTSEAEPVACADCGAKDPFMYPCHQQGCPHSPTPVSDDQVEAVTDEMVERAALALAKRNHVPQWREFIPDARAALLAAMGVPSHEHDV